MPKTHLQSVLDHLSRSPEVNSVFTTGTTASKLGPSSDIDLVVILEKNDARIKSAYTMIENRFADIFFFDVDFVKKLTRSETVSANGFEGIFLTWLAKGKIEKDRTELLSQLKTHLHAKPRTLAISLEEKQDSWFKMNYNFIANHRYFCSEDPLYHNALEIRLLYSVTELIVAYFTLRGIPWRGEKEAIVYFESNDGNMFKIFNAYTMSQSLAERFHTYQELFKAVLYGDFHAWDTDFMIVKDEQNQLDTKLATKVQELIGKTG